ncbi:hypothetical protein LMG26696_05244 [Achromobacter pulmonis]|nr:hypothetical protein LMG26696_05244 [Achromobacter pulmonis]
MNFRIGSVRSLYQAPCSVMMPLIMPPQDGASRISENVMPSDWVQSGSEVYSRWWGPAHM